MNRGRSKMKKTRKKAVSFITIVLASLSLSGCVASLGGHDVSMKETDKNSPVYVDTYDYQGQKADQFKLSSIKIKEDKRIANAIDVDYGENKIVHSSSSLIAYQGVNNYADRYSSMIATRQLDNPSISQGKNAATNKSLPTAGDIYYKYRKQIPANGTVVEVKTQSGSLIGYFAGHRASVLDFGNDDNANAVIKLDDHKIFLYNASYTLYPVSAAKSMWQDKKATTTAMQADIKTHDGTKIVENNSNKK